LVVALLPVLGLSMCAGLHRAELPNSILGGLYTLAFFMVFAGPLVAPSVMRCPSCGNASVGSRYLVQGGRYGRWNGRCSGCDTQLQEPRRQSWSVEREGTALVVKGSPALRRRAALERNAALGLLVGAIALGLGWLVGVVPLSRAAVLVALPMVGLSLVGYLVQALGKSRRAHARIVMGPAGDIDLRGEQRIRAGDVQQVEVRRVSSDETVQYRLELVPHGGGPGILLIEDISSEEPLARGREIAEHLGVAFVAPGTR
jgi:hypothetical protein